MSRKFTPVFYIGVSGPARSGKDTFAEYLQDALYDQRPHLGIAYAPLAWPIKEMVNSLLGICGAKPLRELQKEEVIPELGVSPRRLMQTLGTDWGREVLGDDVWLNIARSQIERYNDIDIAIIPDIRFENEARQMDLLFKVVRSASDRPEVEQHASEIRFENEARQMDLLFKVVRSASDRPEVEQHASEDGFSDNYVHHFIRNNDDLEELKAKADASASRTLQSYDRFTTLLAMYYGSVCDPLELSST